MTSIGYRSAKLVHAVKIAGRFFDKVDVKELKECNIKADLVLSEYGLTVKTSAIHNGIPEDKEYFIPYPQVIQLER